LKEDKMTYKYYNVYVEGLNVRAKSKENAIKLVEKNLKKVFKEGDIFSQFNDGTIVSVNHEWTKKELEEILHLGCPNWPNCDTEGCGGEYD
tara:strand:+ start:267 stop:539 length:273 start_codon:yes stop_codon:yes gene_type:complete